LRKYSLKVPVKIVQKPEIEIPVQSEFIRLDAFLKLANAVESGGQAKVAIQEGRVRVNGEACLLRGKKIRAGDVVRFGGETYVITPSPPAGGAPPRGSLGEGE
jgi:ribosome-associated protein